MHPSSESCSALQHAEILLIRSKHRQRHIGFLHQAFAASFTFVGCARWTCHVHSDAQLVVSATGNVRSRVIEQRIRVQSRGTNQSKVVTRHLAVISRVTTLRHERTHVGIIYNETRCKERSQGVRCETRTHGAVVSLQQQSFVDSPVINVNILVTVGVDKNEATLAAVAQVLVLLSGTAGTRRVDVVLCPAPRGRGRNLLQRLVEQPPAAPGDRH
jgi:hypothetical protein